MSRVILVVVVASLIGGCGISSIRCEIETDEELFERVLESYDGISKEDEEAS